MNTCKYQYVLLCCELVSFIRPRQIYQCILFDFRYNTRIEMFLLNLEKYLKNNNILNLYNIIIFNYSIEYDI